MGRIFVGKTTKYFCSYNLYRNNAVDTGGAGGTRPSPEFGGSEEGQSLISAYRSLAIATKTPKFKKLSMVQLAQQRHWPRYHACTSKRNVPDIILYE